MSLLDNILRVVSDDIVEGGAKAAEKSLPKTARKLKNGIELGAEEIPTFGKNLNMVSPDQNLGGRMLNERGNPVTFYHSTPNEFTRFDDAKLGENTGYENTKLGHFVTTDKDFSKRFIDIDNTGKTGRTMELQARVQNPITHPYMAGSKYGEEELDKIVEDYLLATDNQDGLNMLREYADESGNSLYDEYMDLTMGGESPFENAAEERKLLQDKGYDAVEIVEGPRSGVVEGATEDIPVSSYAVLRGDDLRPVRHIPVEQENYVPLYHQTSANSLDDFSLDKRSAGLSDATMPEGIFLKDTDKDIGLPGKNQLALDAKMENPLMVRDRDDLKYRLMKMDPKVSRYLRNEADLDRMYNNLAEEAQKNVDAAYEKMYYDKTPENQKAFADAAEKMNGIIPEWRQKIKENAAISQKEIKDLLEKNGYDSLIMDEDRGSFGRKVKSYLVMDKGQLRDRSVPVNINNLVPDKEVDFSNIDNELFKNYGTDSDKELYARVMKGGVLDPEEIANSQFVKNLSAAAEEAEKKYGSEIITKEMANNPSTIPEEAMNRMSDLASSIVKEAKSIPGVGYENKAVIFMGGPSSGKSSAGMKYFDAKEGKGGNFFVLDSDDIKPKFKEFGKGEGAGITHEASAFTAESLIKPELMAEGMNLAIPIVGRTQKSLYKQIQSLADNGYDVSVVKVDLPVEKAASRNFARMLESGRNVPDKYVREAVENRPAAVYEQMVEDLKSGKLKGVSGVARIDNDVRRGRLPIAKEYSEGTQIADLMKKLKYRM